MPRHEIDVSTSYSEILGEPLPPSRAIEIADVETLSESDPPLQTVNPEHYLPDPALVEAVDLAIALGRPLLLQGDPGCGKTRLAYAVAYALGLPLEECYIKSTSRAQDLLYTYDAVRRLYEAQLGPAGGQRSTEIRNYLRLGPLGRAIARAQYGRRSVVLIDEIDKADLDFPNDLLWELDRLEFAIAEVPQMRYRAGERPELRPIVFVTHNEEKALPTAFLRRCLFHYVEFPEDEDQLWSILRVHQLENEALARKAIQVLLGLRKLDLSKKPGLSELIDWVGYLEAVQTPASTLDRLPHLGVLLKQQMDQQRAREALAAG